MPSMSPLKSFWIVAAVAASVLAGAPAATLAAEPADKAQGAIVEILSAAQKSQRGVTLWVGGQTVGGAVVRIDEASVELRNQTQSRVVVRLARIDAAGW